MGSSMSGIQPSSLTPSELVRYAELANVNGLPKHWCQELIAVLAAYVLKYGDAAVAEPQEQTPLF